MIPNKPIPSIKIVVDGSKAVIGEYHDYIAMNHKEIVFDPTPEDCNRILREGLISDEELKGML